ncbi:hypothetical protein [Novosphingobium resinovorum]|uniref:hypothetical protein n=1 Tax=Novosphingobium resinovorum TaxID=158500 RepID=UPI002ED146F4|nr:hypothetical protein [Novosphingobium resinovorum]
MSVLLIVAIPYYWLLADGGAGPGMAEARARPVTITQLRTLAGSLPGPRPVELRVETVGIRLNSRNMLVAGGGLRQLPNTVRAYELVVPGSGSIVIDAGISRNAAQEHDFEQYDAAAQARIGFALTKAAHVVLLADRSSHNGGHPAGTRRVGKSPLPATGAPYALAAGVVVIPATGLAPGMNMVYTQLAGGREYLFTGDVAKLSINWRELRLPARLATRDEKVGFRAENLAWLMTINALHRAAPQMTIVAGHDPLRIPFSAGTFSD